MCNRFALPPHFLTASDFLFFPFFLFFLLRLAASKVAQGSTANVSISHPRLTAPPINFSVRAWFAPTEVLLTINEMLRCEKAFWWRHKSWHFPAVCVVTGEHTHTYRWIWVPRNLTMSRFNIFHKSYCKTLFTSSQLFNLELFWRALWLRCVLVYC